VSAAPRDSDADLVVHPVRLARIELPDFHPAAPGSDDVYGFVVRDGVHCVLVDTGVGADHPGIARLYRPEIMDLEETLEGVGASVHQVTAVVNSHLHFDHCGQNARFPGVPIYVQEAELEASRRPYYTVPEWVDFPGARYELIRGAYALSERLELRPTPGHTPGHQSLIVHTRHGIEIVAAQAAYTRAEFDRFQDVGIARLDDCGAPELAACLSENAGASREDYVDSLVGLRELRPRRVYFSHDPEPWESGDG